MGSPSGEAEKEENGMITCLFRVIDPGSSVEDDGSAEVGAGSPAAEPIQKPRQPEGAEA